MNALASAAPAAEPSRAVSPVIPSLPSPFRAPPAARAVSAPCTFSGTGAATAELNATAAGAIDGDRRGP